ncbi:MAG: lipopolysaccharide assembly protein LapA domain-containing protein [Xenococcaceae cyanobacterium]
MIVSIIIALFLAVFSIVFALQNTTYVTVEFLFWQSEGSLALFLLLTLALGVIVGLLISMPTIIKSWKAVKQKGGT